MAAVAPDAVLPSDVRNPVIQDQSARRADEGAPATLLAAFRENRRIWCIDPAEPVQEAEQKVLLHSRSRSLVGRGKADMPMQAGRRIPGD